MAISEHQCFVCGDPAEGTCDSCGDVPFCHSHLTKHLSIRILERLVLEGAEIAFMERPTTVCDLCEVVVPVEDTYISKKNGRVLCEGCFHRLRAIGRAKEY